MRTPRLSLERFDAPLAPLKGESKAESGLQEARAEGYREGYAAGEAAALAGENEDTQLIAALTAALEAEAAATPERVARETGETVRILIEKLFPALAKEGFAVEAAAAVAKIAGKRRNLAIDIAVSPDEAPAVEALLGKFAPDAKVAVIADAAIDGTVARAAWENGGMDFDLEGATQECLAAFRNAVSTLKNGDRS